jgi:hypothetical protein
MGFDLGQRCWLLVSNALYLEGVLSSAMTYEHALADRETPNRAAAHKPHNKPAAHSVQRRCELSGRLRGEMVGCLGPTAGHMVELGISDVGYFCTRNEDICLW